MKLSIEQIKEFVAYLCREEKSTATQEKYLRDVQAFCAAKRRNPSPSCHTAPKIQATPLNCLSVNKIF